MSKMKFKSRCETWEFSCGRTGHRAGQKKIGRHRTFNKACNKRLIVEKEEKQCYSDRKSNFHHFSKPIYRNSLNVCFYFSEQPLS